MASPYLPDFSEMLAVSHSHGADGEAPESWDDLAGLWPIAAGGGPTAYDLSGYGTHGAIDGATWVSSPLGPALNFDDVDDQTLFPATNQFTNLPALTICARIRVVTPRGSGGCIMTLGGVGFSSGEWRFLAAGLDLQWAADFTGGDPFAQTAAVLTQGAWHDVAVTWNGGNNVSTTDIRFWLDGVSVAPDSTGSGANRKDETGLQLQLCDAGFGDIQIAWAGLWSRMLDASEIRTMHVNPNALVTPQSRTVVKAPAAVGSIMNQLQGSNVGADLYNGALSV